MIFSILGFVINMGYADVCFKRIVYCESDKSIYRIKVIIMKLSCVGDIGNVDKKSRAIIDPAACPFVITKEINSGL